MSNSGCPAAIQVLPCAPKAVASPRLGTSVFVRQALTVCSEPIVSVIVPCYNQARFLPDAIESLRRQTFRNWEALVVDDGSTDETSDVGNGFSVLDGRVRLLRKANGGLSSARNFGLAQVRGRWVQFLDADDLLLPDKLAVQVAAVERQVAPAVSYTDYWHGDAANPYVRVAGLRLPCTFAAADPIYDMAYRWETAFSIPIHAGLFDTALFTRHGIRFNESLPNHEDWFFWMQVLMRVRTIAFVPRELAVYRVHHQSMSRNRNAMRLGFQQALALMLQEVGDRPDVRSMLMAKRRLTDWSYHHGWRVATHDALIGSSLAKRFMPWPMQRAMRGALSPSHPQFPTRPFTAPVPPKVIVVNPKASGPDEEGPVLVTPSR